MVVDELDTLKYELRLQRYIYKEKYIFEGEAINQYLLPEIPIYAPLKFKTKRQRQQYNKLVYNVKKVLPLAQQVNALIKETYETNPDKLYDLCDSFNYLVESGLSGTTFLVAEKEFNINTLSDLTEAESVLKN